MVMDPNFYSSPINLIPVLDNFGGLKCRLQMCNKFIDRRMFVMTSNVRGYIISQKETFQKIGRRLPYNEIGSTVKLQLMLRYVCLEFVNLHSGSPPSLETDRFHKHLLGLVIETVLF